MFLAEYGAQLLCASLTNMEPELCAHLMACCPNVRLSYVKQFHCFGSVAALGEHVDSLVISLEHQSNLGDRELRSAMASCKQVTSLEVGTSLRSPLPLAAWQAIFSAPMRKLRKLSLPTIR